MSFRASKFNVRAKIIYQPLDTQVAQSMPLHQFRRYEKHSISLKAGQDVREARLVAGSLRWWM